MKKIVYKNVARPILAQFSPSLLRIVAECVTLCFRHQGTSDSLPHVVASLVSAVSTNVVFPVGRCSAKPTAAQYLDEDIRNLDATCNAGNYVDLSKLDPHHTFSSSGVPLNEKCRPWAWPFAMENCSAIFSIIFNVCGAIFPLLNLSSQKLSRTKIPPPPAVADEDSF